MARRSEKAPFSPNEEEFERLKKLAGSRTAAKREVERAEILLQYAGGESITDIRKRVGVRRPTINKCIDKALTAGIETALKETYHRPKAPDTAPDASGSVVSLSCTKPKELGLAAELWTISALA
jgi:hypothetical protein